MSLVETQNTCARCGLTFLHAEPRPRGWICADCEHENVTIPTFVGLELTWTDDDNAVVSHTADPPTPVAKLRWIVNEWIVVSLDEWGMELGGTGVLEHPDYNDLRQHLVRSELNETILNAEMVALNLRATVFRDATRDQAEFFAKVLAKRWVEEGRPYSQPE